jgi:hypothetical protein
MQNGQKTMMNKHRPKSARPFANRSKQWTLNGARPEPRSSGNAQRNYHRYLALAQAQSGDIVGAENYYQTPSIILDPCLRAEKRHKRPANGTDEINE